MYILYLLKVCIVICDTFYFIDTKSCVTNQESKCFDLHLIAVLWVNTQFTMESKYMTS